MDKNKAIIIGVLVVLIGALGFMKYNEAPPELESHDEQPTPTAKATPSEKSNVAKSDATNNAAQQPSTPAASTPDASELKKTDLKIGTGKEAKTGDHVTVNYRGTLTNGTVFDESYKRGQPFDFTLGQGSVIKGWDEGVVGMKVGGKRKLVIPPDLGYGPNGQGPIPPNATLTFEIELLKVG